MGNQGGINVSVTVSVLLVPFHSCLQSLFPRPFFLPSQFMQFRRIDGVTQIVKLSVRHHGNPLFFLSLTAKGLEERACHFNIGDFILTTDIVDVSRNTLVQNDIKSRSDILDIQKVSSVGSVTMNGEGQVFQQLIGELGDELFRELMGSINVVSSRNQARQFEGTEVRLDQEFSASLCGSVGIGGFQNMFFRHGIRFEIFSFSIDFIGGNMNESFDGRAHFGGFQENVRAINVGLCKGKRVSERVVDMGLCRKVHNGINLFLSKNIRNQVGGRNVTLDKFEIRQVEQLFQVGQTGTIVEVVVNDDFVLGVLLTQKDCHVRCNETGTASHHDALGLIGG
mmetsp:Transcript_2458/g.5075  ORF Transcript_2458/g.5075 Transcript_2458/m.5075 type:complete len:338 (+) Transcript_2458:1664-2677(+)